MNQTPDNRTPEAMISRWPSDEGKRDLTLLMELLVILSHYAHEDGAGGMYGEGAVDTLERITRELDEYRVRGSSETGFLIERPHPERGGVTTYWDGIDFTDWSQLAIRFAREQDAARTIYCSGWKEGFVRVGRHYWGPEGRAERGQVIPKPSPPPNHDLRTGDYPKDQVDPVGWDRR